VLSSELNFGVLHGMFCFAPGSRPDTHVKHTAPEIIKALRLLGPYKFCPSDVSSKLDYDMLYLDASKILLTCHGDVVGSTVDGEHLLSVDQSFILHRPVAGQDDK
jgi:hypothetical protein